MKTFASKEKRSAPAVRKTRPYVHHPMGPVQLAQRAEIHRILRSTGAQAKLTVGEPNDKYEQEADRVADRVMRMSNADVAQQVETGRIQRMCSACEAEQALQRQPIEEEEEELQAKSADERMQRQPIEEEEEELQAKFADEHMQRQPEEEEETLQAKSDGKKSGLQVSPQLESRIHSLKGSGRPLSKNERQFFEPRFGSDFSDVRVHTDTRAANAATSIHARAFAKGRHVVFGSGQYAPEAIKGKRLLAHELTHVVQQTENSLVQRKPREARILKTSRDYKIPPGTSGCYLHLLLLIDAGRNVPRLTTAGEVAKYRKYKKIARGATVSDLVAVLRKKGIAKRSRWFSYPKAGRSFKTFKKLNLRGDPEGFVMSRVRTGQPAYFAVGFRNIHSGFILVTSARKVLWLDQIYRGGKDVTGKLNKFLSRFLDNYVESNRKLHAWYGSTKITELRF